MGRPKSIVSKSEIAEELHLSKGRISQLIAAGGFPVRSDGKIDRDKAVEWYRSNIRPRLKPGSRKPPPKREGGSEGGHSADDLRRARIKALAEVAKPAEVLEFASACRRIGLSPAQACAVGQMYASRVLEYLNLEEINELPEPSEAQWMEALGSFDIDEADQMVCSGSA